MRSLSARFWITLLLTSTVIAFRDPDWWVHPQFFAEDGTIFFEQQILHGVSALMVPYAGYLHVIPRLIAWLASVLPVFWQPLCYQLFAVLIAGACAAFFASSECRFIIESDDLRMAVSLLAVADCSGRDLFANIATLAVILFPVALVLLVSGRESIARAMVAGLIVLTSPGLILFIPLSLWRVVRYKSLVAGSFLICSVIQLTVLFTASTPANRAAYPLWLPAIATVEAEVYRVIIATVAGLDSVITLGAHHGFGFAVTILGIVSVLFLILYRSVRLQPRQKAVWWSCLALGPIMLLEVFVMRTEMLPYFTNLGIFFYTSASRYFFTPTLLFFVVVALFIEHFNLKWSQKTRAFAMLLIFSFSTYRNYEVVPLDDLNWAFQAKRIEDWKRQPSVPIAVPINPKWTISLP